MPDYTEQEEKDIVDAARTGSESALNQLARRYHKPLVGFVLSRIGCSREDAEDIAQDVWLKVFSDLHKSPAEGGYDAGKGAFYTFIINRYAKFHLLQYIERTRRRGTEAFGGDEDDSSHIDPQIADDQPTIDVVMVDEEDNALRASAIEECFRLTFRYGGYPHQVLAFGYSKLVYGQSTQREASGPVKRMPKRKREIEGDPKRVDNEHGGNPLTLVASSFWSDYSQVSGLDDSTLARMHTYLEPTRQRLILQLAELARDNKAFRDHHGALLRQVVGETHIRDYYGSRGLNAIADWCDKVQNRIREKLGIGRGAGGAEE